MEGGYGLTGGWDSLWDWQTADATQFLWDCHNQDDDELLGLLGNQTPPRDCCDFFADLGDITYKETLDLEESQESKRQRTLEYPSESSQSKVARTSKIAPTTESFVMQETRKPSTLKVSKAYPFTLIKPSQEEGTSEIAPTTESFVMQETRKPSTLKVSKAFPFALIKLSREESDVTLQDINQQNQRIHAPPKKAPEILGTSHLSGKPVIGMTRIRTEGGRGSITILRTKD
ncbi:hypothetical protein SORBI_3004G258000 [Sorghum bicolor]|uniref:Protein XRI1 n=1 Tax=Sorghum bicolor TaxID=4558 RepID=A0A1Z5RPY8_SORBI|nr:hypothetical protein SORBI_3004G258000 [Sorghum bicolor]